MITSIWEAGCLTLFERHPSESLKDRLELSTVKIFRHRIATARRIYKYLSSTSPELASLLEEAFLKGASLGSRDVYEHAKIYVADAHLEGRFWRMLIGCIWGNICYSGVVVADSAKISAILRKSGLASKISYPAGVCFTGLRLKFFPGLGRFRFTKYALSSASASEASPTEVISSFKRYLADGMPERIKPSMLIPFPTLLKVGKKLVEGPRTLHIPIVVDAVPEIVEEGENYIEASLNTGRCSISTCFVWGRSVSAVTDLASPEAGKQSFLVIHPLASEVTERAVGFAPVKSLPESRRLIYEPGAEDDTFSFNSVQLIRQLSSVAAKSRPVRGRLVCANCRFEIPITINIPPGEATCPQCGSVVLCPAPEGANFNKKDLFLSYDLFKYYHDKAIYTLIYLRIPPKKAAKLLDRYSSLSYEEFVDKITPQRRLRRRS
jgi:hypothetical protein